ncbi:MAG: hypothetical protein CVV51_09320 [Spirochaetae bacterium HGW-Spirochaetae-7]|jgi:ribosomal-protein-alanine N-acetyltransferase|nr:MAG: hypothetical protein CVV51_09320 [Spirochaetae bacterium HGW-Spirochaetae-7]
MMAVLDDQWRGRNVLKMPETIDIGILLLRRPRLTDIDAIFEYGSDQQVSYYADWKRLTDKTSLESRLISRDEAWMDGTEYNWVITEKVNDTAIGGLSCTIQDGKAEIGYLLNRKYWNRGYTTDVVKKVIGILVNDACVKSVWATCDKDNAGSIRVLEKSGMKREKLLKKFRVRPNISEKPRDAYLYIYRAV